ncbi:MAG: iron-sulfur cluster assembly protein, partial [Chloroflexota bacterium]
MPVTEPQVMAALSRVKDPEIGKDVVSLGMIKDLSISGDQVGLTLELTTPACPVSDSFKQSVHDAVAALPGVAAVAVKMTAQVRHAQSSSGGAG